MKKILVTGGAGFIGSHVVLELLHSGYEAIIVDNFYNSCPEIITRLNSLKPHGSHFSVVEADICDQVAMDTLFKEHNFHAVIHCAGYKAVAESVAKPLEYYKNNLLGTIVLCEVMKKYDVTRLIFSSSATVYGAPHYLPIDETHPTGGCTNPYGWTKWMNEQILRDVAHANTEWSVILLRYFNPIGAHKSGKIGDAPQGIPNNIAPIITQAAIGKLPYIAVTGNDYDTPDGTGVRDYIHILDLASGHVAALTYLDTHTGVEAVNLGTGHGTSVLELIHGFEKAVGHTIPQKFSERRPGDIASCYCTPAKAHRLFGGWSAVHTAEEMCADAWRWQSQNPEGYK